MGLRTTVKVGSITNLSDARYCAGMGVDILGFNAVEGEPDYIAPIPFQELRGWFVGPRVVAEMYGVTQPDKFEVLLHEYQPDMIELSVHELLKLRPKEIPLILSIDPDHITDQRAVLRDFQAQLKYLLIPATTDQMVVKDMASQYDVLLALEKGDKVDIEFLSQHPAIGLALKGTPEERAGYKSYDGLALVLEQLQED
jgi:phosphoribosylanthranilate isomerase